jgi:antitoxin component YwqK of YwqJK toxin-antitoxin module
MKVLTFLIFLLVAYPSISQVNMTNKEVFYYLLRVNNTSPDAMAYTSYGFTTGNSSLQWIDLYALAFDKDNYVMTSKDEFQRMPYRNKIFKEMNEGIKNVNLNKVFSLFAQTTFGTYDAYSGGFPLDRHNFLNYFPYLLYPKEMSYRIGVGNLFNFNDFDFILKMSSQVGQNFLSLRKDTRGNINRKINLKVFYNIIDKPGTQNEYKFFMNIYVHKIEIYDGEKLLGQCLPKYNYFDKVNYVKLRAGSDKEFFNSDWQQIDVNDSQNASFYRITNYKDGKIQNPIIDYYISGAPQMVGNYSEYGDLRNGLFTWYYENGQKESEVTYLSGWREGFFRSWHPNGKKKEEVNFINDKQSGCDYQWDDGGNCIRGSTASWGDYAEYYENGVNQVGSSQCPCENQN